MRPISVLACLSFLAGPASALDLTLSGAREVASVATEAGSVRLPDAPWSADVRPPEVEGAIRRSVLQTTVGTRTTLQLMTPLRDQLAAEGFEQVFTCADRACGGFDFRFQLDLIGEPDMHVDLGDYRYLLMRRNDSDPHSVSIVSSRSANAGFVHITEVGDAVLPAVAPEDAEDTPGTAGAPSPTDDGLSAALLAQGFAVLPDVAFPSGSATLDPGPSASLDALAAWMRETPGARVALVGHTDSVGAPEANRALSRRRAEAVRARLIEAYGIAGDRLEADGVGYLSPVAPNTTEEGRARNRRVEAVLLSLE